MTDTTSASLNAAGGVTPDVFARHPRPWRLDSPDLVDANGVEFCAGWYGTEDLAAFIVAAVNAYEPQKEATDDPA